MDKVVPQSLQDITSPTTVIEDRLIMGAVDEMAAYRADLGLPPGNRAHDHEILTMLARGEINIPALTRLIPEIENEARAKLGLGATPTSALFHGNNAQSALIIDRGLVNGNIPDLEQIAAMSQTFALVALRVLELSNTNPYEITLHIDRGVDLIFNINGSSA